ncbi:MAG: hypothetical protein GEU93_05730 [Propionibacteriales bacterium]|nr:hypothetical protein [Propionibacteriales bacterium]
MRWSRGRAAAAGAAVCAVLASSCVQIPDSGRVNAGPTVGTDIEQQPEFAPELKPGAVPVEVVGGYLDAMGALLTDPAGVRQFLTGRAAARWPLPDAMTRIYTTRPTAEKVGKGRVRVTAELMASLTARGEWVSPRRAGPLSHEFRLRREGGEWRIDNPLPGRLISRDDFGQFGSYSLYFFDPGRRVLVPERVYLPPVGQQVPTLLLRGLITGPSRWLQGAVDSLVPVTADPAVAVPVDDVGVATVELGSGLKGLAGKQRQLLAAQLAWTLGQVPEVDSLVVTSGGSPVQLDGSGTVVQTDRAGREYDPTDAAASGALYARQGNRLVEIGDDGLVRSVSGPLGNGRVDVEAFAVDRTGQTGAAVDGDGTRIVVAPLDETGSEVWWRGATELSGLQWDGHGVLWALNQTASGSRFSVLRDGNRRPVRMGRGAPAEITAFSVSRDGGRIAVVTGDGPSARLMIGRVRRPMDYSLGIAVDRWYTVRNPELPLRGYVDVAWVAPTELEVVASGRASSQQTFLVSVDGASVAASSLIDFGVVTGIAASPASSESNLPTVATTRSGVLWERRSDRPEVPQDSFRSLSTRTWEQLTGDDVRLSDPSYVE